MTPAQGFALRTLSTSAGDLPCVVRGPESGLRLLIVPPLFEEMNRCRHLLSLIARLLAAQGIGSWLIDLPGTGDAEGIADWATWRRAVLAAIDALTLDGAPPLVLAMRGGALLVPREIDRCLFAPVADGASLLRDLLRSRVAADREAGVESRVAAFDTALRGGETLDLAGYAITPALAAALRTAQLDDAGAFVLTVGDGGLPGAPVWRQADPDPAAALAAAAAAAIAEWTRSCAAR